MDFPPETAAWIREHVWPRDLQIRYVNLPDRVLNCACEIDMIRHAHPGEHCGCQRYSDPFAPVWETEIRGWRGHRRAVSQYTHETRFPHAAFRVYEPMVWLADRVCRPRCSCDCHRHHNAAPGGQTSLF
jgi:hypothetical protein